MIESINPFTLESIAIYRPHSQEEIDERLDRSTACFALWKTSSFLRRTELLLELAKGLRARKKDFALLMAEEMGKPFTQGEAEINKCAWLCEFYAEHGEEYLKPESVLIEGQSSLIFNEPLGSILGVMPWNYPFWQAFRFIVPTILAGNTILLKHASNVTGCAQEIEQLFAESSAPSGLFELFLLPGREVSALIGDPRIHGVSLTGSEPAGAAVASMAGKVIKPSLLELGGNNAFIVMDDADLERALESFFISRFQNNGQSCIASKRLILHEDIAVKFVEMLEDKIDQMIHGEPSKPDTFMGPLARVDLAKELDEQVQESIRQGAQLVRGGKREGAYYEPTILTNIDREMAVFKEETFGPVVAVSVVGSFSEAIEMSNDSRFGLGVSIFTNDIEQVLDRSDAFNEGAVFVNDFVKSDPRLPFGGVKVSGYGRELGRDGALAFVNRKVLVINNPEADNN